MNLGASAISSPQGTGEVSPALLPSGPDPGPFACRGLGDWGCTCHPLSCCSQRLLPGTHTPVPWVPAWPLASIQPSRWLEASSSSPLLPWLPGYRKVGRNPLLHIPPSSTPVGFARTFQPWVRKGMRAQPDTQALCVCVCVCGSAVAIMLAEQFRAPKGTMDRGQGGGLQGPVSSLSPILDS